MNITPELRQWAVEQANILLQRGHMDDDSLEDANLRLVQVAHQLTVYVSKGHDEIRERQLVHNVLNVIQHMMFSGPSSLDHFFKQLSDEMKMLEEFWREMSEKTRLK